MVKWSGGTTHQLELAVLVGWVPGVELCRGDSPSLHLAVCFSTPAQDVAVVWVTPIEEGGCSGCSLAELPSAALLHVQLGSGHLPRRGRALQREGGLDSCLHCRTVVPGEIPASGLPAEARSPMASAVLSPFVELQVPPQHPATCSSSPCCCSLLTPLLFSLPFSLVPRSSSGR